MRHRALYDAFLIFRTPHDFFRFSTREESKLTGETEIRLTPGTRDLFNVITNTMSVIFVICLFTEKPFLGPFLRRTNREQAAP